MNENQDVLALKCLISTAFLSGLPITRSLWSKVKESFEILEDKFSGEELAGFAIDASVNHTDAVRFPRNSGYTKSVVEWFRDLWNSKNWNGDDLFKIGTTGDKEFEKLEIGYKTYQIGFDNSSITLLESIEGISRGTTGLSSWGAAKVLASWCIGNTHIFEGSKVLELGAGIGYTAASILSSPETNKIISSYTATDYHPQVLSMLHHNLYLLRASFCQTIPSREQLENFCLMMNAKLVSEELPPGEFRKWGEQEEVFQIGKTKVTVEQLDWRQSVNIPECDVVLAADVVYAKHLFPDLVRVIRELLLSNEKKAILHHIKSRTDLQEGISLLQIPPRNTNGSRNHEVNEVQIFPARACSDRECSPEYLEAAPNSRKQPTAFVACTRRNQETISEFLSEVNKQELFYKQVYQTTLERDESLFGFNESYLPIKIYKITCEVNQ